MRFSIFILLWLGVAHAGPQKLAVLELMDHAQLGDGPARYLTDQVRGVAADLPHDAWFVLTRENLLEILPPGADLADCEGDCEVQTGRNIGVDRVISGDITRLGSELRITLRMHDTKAGSLLGQQTAKATAIEALDAPLKRAAQALLAQLNPKRGAGRLQVRTLRSVTVRINGVEVGHGPQVRKELPTGRHIIELQSPCHQRLEVPVTIEAGALATVSITPKKQLATLNLETMDAAGAPLEAQVLVDGVDLGHSPGSFQVPVCAKALKLTAGTRVAEETLHLDAERATTLTVMLKATGSKHAEKTAKKSARSVSTYWPKWLMIYGLGATALGYVFYASNKSEGEDLQRSPNDVNLRESVNSSYKASMGWYIGGAALMAVGATWWIFAGDDEDESAAQLGLGVGPGSVNLGGRW